MQKHSAGMDRRSLLSTGIFTCIILSVFIFTAIAAPHDGEEFMLRQPDGSEVLVLVWGDEFYQTVESPDGYTLIRDEDGWITYASLSADGNEYVSTGVRYTNSSRAPAVQRRMRINRESFERKHRRNKEALGFDNADMIPEDRRRGPVPPGVAPAPANVQTTVGLTVLINFPGGTNPRTGQQNAAVRSSVTRQAMDDFCNREGGFNGTNGAGSVRDYFLDASNGTLDYRNIVADFVEVAFPKNYYDTLSNYQFVPELIQSALTVIKQRVESGQLDLSGISTEGTNNTVMALNIMYAGSASQGWSNGIWPHSGTYRAPGNTSHSVTSGAVPSGALTINVPAGNGNPARTVRFSRYQFASLGTGANPPGIGTFVHENGHMIMRWPDLYNYDNTVTNVVSSYCVMSSSNGSNPQMPNPHFRNQAGWITVTNITNMNATLSHTANSSEAFQFVRNSQESYFIEARRRTGRSANISGEGLIIWHVHTNGVNTALNTQRPFPLVKVVQANNTASTTTAFPDAPGANAPFRNGGSPSTGNTALSVTQRVFGRNTSPAALYHDGTASNIDITEISASANIMSFRIGSGTAGPAQYLLTVEGGTGSGLYSADSSVTIRAPETNTAGRSFMYWNSYDTAALNRIADIYACTTTVRTRPAEVTISALHARAFALPGNVEADTFGLAQGITSASNTANGATGNRVARVTDASQFADYVVNVTEEGEYQLSYRLLTGTASAGRFIIRDMTNGGITLDSVIVPASTRTSMQTIDGEVVALKEGKAVWRLEALSGNYSIDWFGAELSSPPPPTTFLLTVENGSGGGRYDPDTEVTISAPETNSDGRFFLRWNSATLEPGDIYAFTTTVTTEAVDAAVTAIYSRAFVLPGNVEADTFGYAQGITSVSNTANGATGSRVARITSTSLFAEYMVDVSDSGSYRLSYRLLTGTASAGSFIIRDMTNGGIVLDSVIVPASSTTSMQTVLGREAVLNSGKAVWRLEPISGNYSIDWFAAQPSQNVSIVNTASRALSYDMKARGGKISFSVPNAGHVSVKMYDVRGRVAAVLSDGVKNPGVYNINLPQSNIGQGLYIVRMKSSGYVKDLKVHYRK